MILLMQRGASNIQIGKLAGVQMTKEQSKTISIYTALSLYTLCSWVHPQCGSGTGENFGSLRWKQEENRRRRTKTQI